MLWLLTWLTMGNMWDVATLIMFAPSSLSYELADSIADGSPHVLAFWYVACALMILPYLVQLTFPALRLRRFVARVACLGAALAASAWVMQAFLAGQHEGFAVIKFLYVRAGAESMAYAVFLGILLNTDLRRAAEAEGVDTQSAERVRLDSRPMGLH